MQDPSPPPGRDPHPTQDPPPPPDPQTPPPLQHQPRPPTSPGPTVQCAALDVSGWSRSWMSSVRRPCGSETRRTAAGTSAWPDPTNPCTTTLSSTRSGIFCVFYHFRENKGTVTAKKMYGFQSDPISPWQIFPFPVIPLPLGTLSLSLSLSLGFFLSFLSLTGKMLFLPFIFWSGHNTGSVCKLSCPNEGMFLCLFSTLNLERFCASVSASTTTLALTTPLR